MSGKSAKIKHNIEKAKEVDYQERVNSMLKEVRELSVKYKIDLVAGLQYKQMGILPMIYYVDMKEQYEHMTEEAKKVEKAKSEAEQENTDSPKLEV